MTSFKLAFKSSKHLFNSFKNVESLGIGIDFTFSPSTMATVPEISIHCYLYGQLDNVFVLPREPVNMFFSFHFSSFLSNSLDLKSGAHIFAMLD
jgi:hypothetical protein